MFRLNKTSLTIYVGFIVVLTIVAYILYQDKSTQTPPFVEPQTAVEEETVQEESLVQEEIVGYSVQNRPITAYTFGTGEHHLMFIGGIHGGYEWNSVILAYELFDYINENPDYLPENISVTIIPSANPDGVFEVIGKEGRFTLSEAPKTENATGLGRFNANNVDLNRNFACKWQPESTWRGNVVSAGTSAFSEPEAQAIRIAVQKYNPNAVLFFHSQANAVYASECHTGVLPETTTIMNIYANATGYEAVETFDAYEITGDAEGWLASIGIPALTVELETHETVEWQRNKQGIDALLSYYSQK
jgi:hypothetical protein